MCVFLYPFDPKTKLVVGNMLLLLLPAGKLLFRKPAGFGLLFLFFFFSFNFVFGFVLLCCILLYYKKIYGKSYLIVHWKT